jgi:ATP-dependent 26S proteasome regulatory subunit
MVYVAPPDIEARAEIFRIRVKKMACSPDVDIEKLANMVCTVKLLMQLSLTQEQE